MSYLKRLTNAALGRLQAFRMYGGIGMSVSSLHRESTDSLIYRSHTELTKLSIYYVLTATLLLPSARYIRTLIWWPNLHMLLPPLSSSPLPHPSFPSPPLSLPPSLPPSLSLLFSPSPPSIFSSLCPLSRWCIHTDMTTSIQALSLCFHNTGIFGGVYTSHGLQSLEPLITNSLPTINTLYTELYASSRVASPSTLYNISSE